LTPNAFRGAGQGVDTSKRHEKLVRGHINSDQKYDRPEYDDLLEDMITNNYPFLSLKKLRRIIRDIP
jgi:hypothetical protein